MGEHIHFVTGRLAEHALRRVVEELAARLHFDYSIQVLPITVAALITPRWAAPRVRPPQAATRLLMPGYCGGDLSPIAEAAQLPVERGPRDLHRLGEYFGQPAERAAYGAYEIEIIAEINHCPRLPLREILQQADRLRADGADVIDVGCEPGETWRGVAETVRALRDRGQRVSIDSFDPAEIAAATAAGAELVLSVNSSNRHAAADWGCEVVAIPDTPRDLASLDETVEQLAASGVPARIDPILEPIGFGFADSLGRYLHVRRQYPEAALMMGIGNITELTDSDSAGVNVVLLGFCQEQRIASVLTTQVVGWARSSVRECDLARRLVHHAVTNRVLPKHLEPRLVVLRDVAVVERSDEELDRLAEQIKDHDVRLFVARSKIHGVIAGLHWAAEDPFALFAELLVRRPGQIDPGHAFYLGFEACKALVAVTLGKNYVQDESLDWGFLTQVENFHRLARTRPHAPPASRKKPTQP